MSTNRTGPRGWSSSALWKAFTGAALLAAGASLATAPATARDSGSCTSPEARAFDFWIGDWTIEQKIRAQDGSWLTLPARTSVSPALDGCALLERWEGQVQFFWEGMEAPEPIEGLSVRAYDPASGEWRIHWMDTRSPRFGPPFAGGFREGRGEFTRERETPQGKRLTRISFSDVTEDSVRWELAVSGDEGASWSTLWVMDMRRTGD